MTPSQAAELVTYLVAVFRPRDFGDASATAYAKSIQEFDYHETRRAIEWLAEHERFMPALATIRAEAADDYSAPPIETLDRTKLPGYRPPALPGEVAKEVPAAPRPSGGVLTRERDPHIAYDPEEVKRRKAEARAAARKERRRLANEAKGKAS